MARLGAIYRFGVRARLGQMVMALAALLLIAVPARAERTEHFGFVDPVNIGASLPRSVVNWEYFLGTDFQSDPFSFGGITGSSNAVVIPQVSAGPVIIVPEVRADTRTGLKVNGQVNGRTGINLQAGFDSGGLDTGANFMFGPNLVLPDTINSGEFFDMRGSVGLDSGATFDVDLPSVNTAADLIFELDASGDMEAGLFPFVDYRRGPWGFDLDIDFSLFDLDFDLNLPEFPEFKFFDVEIPELADAEGDVFRKQISVNPKPETPDGPTPPGPRIDVGEVQLVKPTGANVQVHRDVNADGFSYVIDADLMRLGIDIDGLVTAALAGNSFTRQEFEIGDYGKIVAELIDVKYGPELGLEVHNNVTPYLLADLTFDGQVVLDEDGAIRIVEAGETVSVRWDQIPDLALLGTDPVNVDVGFTAMQALLSQSGNLTLTDYMELRALELSAIANIGELSKELADVGPLIHKRFSILGELLGEFDIPIWETDFAPVVLNLPDTILNTMHQFTLTPTPSMRVYMNSDDFDVDPSLFYELNSGSVPGTLSGKTLVIGRGDGTQSTTAELTPNAAVDEGTIYTFTPAPNPFIPNPQPITYRDARPSAVIDLAGIEVLEGSSYTQAGARDFRLTRVSNDGLFHGTGYTELRAAGDFLNFEGDGVMRFDGPTEIITDVLVNGAGHTVIFNEPQAIAVYDVLHFGVEMEVAKIRHRLHIGQAINNSGHIVFDHIDWIAQEGTFGFGLTNNEGASFTLQEGATMRLSTGALRNEGLIHVLHPDRVVGQDLRSDLIFANDITLRDSKGTGEFRAEPQGAIIFVGSTIIDNHARFVADGEGAQIAFYELLDANESEVDLITDNGGEIILNGIEFPEVMSSSQFEPGVNIVNRGLLNVQSGKNLLFLQGALSPDGGGTDSVIKPINLVNEGEVRIWGGAQFGFEIEITDYAEGGATLAGGEWTLLGATPTGTYFNNTTDPDTIDDDRAALLITEITKITNNGNVLGESFDLENFDTDLRTNAAAVTLSGEALFPYFNTLADNRGSLTLDNKHRFTTAGDLHNRGTIDVLGNSRLDVTGDLVVDEGTLFVENGSQLSTGSNTVEVIGGTLTFERSPGAIFVNTPWIVREKTIVDELGNETVLPALVEYPNNTIETIGPAADITLAGAQARMQPLDGLRQIDGKLSIIEGNQFAVTQDVSVGPQGTLIVDTAGKMLIDGDLTSFGDLTVGNEAYLKADAVNINEGSVILDGVIEAMQVFVSSSASVTGSGTFSGNVANSGQFSPGSSPGIAEIFGGYTQDVEATLTMEIFGDRPGLDHDRLIVHGDVNFNGLLELVIADNMTTRPHVWNLIALEQAAIGQFDDVILTIAPSTGLAGDTTNAGSVDPALLQPIFSPDDLLLEDLGDYRIYLSYVGGDGDDVVLYTVPEPATVLVMFLLLPILAMRRSATAKAWTGPGR